jgi:hypothetical protein
LYFFVNHYLLQNVLGNYSAWMVFMTLKKKIKSLAKQSIELSAFKISFCLIWHLCLLPECTFQCRVTYLNATFFLFLSFFLLLPKCHFHAEFKIAQNAWPLDFRKLINIFTFWKKKYSNLFIVSCFQLHEKCHMCLQFTRTWLKMFYVLDSNQWKHGRKKDPLFLLILLQPYN